MWEHKGYTISVDLNGIFEAQHGSDTEPTVRSSSLVECESGIDDLEKKLMSSRKRPDIPVIFSNGKKNVVRGLNAGTGRPNLVHFNHDAFSNMFYDVPVVERMIVDRSIYQKKAQDIAELLETYILPSLSRHNKTLDNIVAVEQEMATKYAQFESEATKESSN